MSCCYGSLEAAEASTSWPSLCTTSTKAYVFSSFKFHTVQFLSWRVCVRRCIPLSGVCIRESTNDISQFIGSHSSRYIYMSCWIKRLDQFALTSKWYWKSTAVFACLWLIINALEYMSTQKNSIAVVLTRFEIIARPVCIYGQLISHGCTWFWSWKLCFRNTSNVTTHICLMLVFDMSYLSLRKRTDWKDMAIGWGCYQAQMLWVTMVNASTSGEN
jgi:hypothetical protein